MRLSDESVEVSWPRRVHPEGRLRQLEYTTSSGRSVLLLAAVVDRTLSNRTSASVLVFSNYGHQSAYNNQLCPAEPSQCPRTDIRVIY